MTKREVGDIHSASIVGLEDEYLAGLAQVAARRRDGEHLFVLFLGSTIGNSDGGADVRFLWDVRRTSALGDALFRR